MRLLEVIGKMNAIEGIQQFLPWNLQQLSTSLPR
jgi:hypothetical protein